MELDYLVSAAVTLLLVVDPIGLVPSFIALTDGLPKTVRGQIGRRAARIAVLILLGAALFGSWLLHHLGITLPAFRIAGGLLLFATAFEMVLGVRVERQARTAEQAVEERAHDIAAFPLAIPLLAGPGAITATVLLAGQANGNTVRAIILLAVIVAVCLLCVGVFAVATRIADVLGATGNSVLSRLLGVLLAALAVQYVIDGARAVFS